MDIEDMATRQLLTRLIAKRKEYVVNSLIKLYPEKETKLKDILSCSLRADFLEPLVRIPRLPKENEALDGPE